MSALCVLVAGLAGLSMLAPGCGGGSAAPSVASVGTTSATGTASAGSGGSTGSGSSIGDQVAFAKCMRSHGVLSFPDPSSSGGFDTRGIDRTSPQFHSAQEACHALAPTHNVAQVKRHVKVLLAYAACMRKHGLTWFPDPTSQGSFVVSPGSPAAANWNPSSPLFQAADNACHSLNPGTG